MIALGVIGQTQEIINGYTVKVGKLDQDICGNIPLTQFIVAVNLLGAIKNLCHLALFQVSIFPQISNSLIHNITLY